MRDISSGNIGLAIDRRRAMVAMPIVAVALGQAAPAVALERAAAPGAAFAFAATFRFDAPHAIERTPAGRRLSHPIRGGEIIGSKLRGAILPAGEVTRMIRPDGCTAIGASYWLETDDGIVIHVVDQGIVRPDYGRSAPRFDAPVGPHDWLNRTAFVGDLDTTTGLRAATARMRVFALT